MKTARKVALWPILGMASTQSGSAPGEPARISNMESEAAVPLPSETSLPTISTPSSTVSALADVTNSLPALTKYSEGTV